MQKPSQPAVPLHSTQVQPQEAVVPQIQMFGFRVAYLEAIDTQETTFTFNDLGGATVFASTALSHVSTALFGGTASAAWACFSEYSDASGSHPISNQVTTWLTISGATSITCKVHVQNGYAQSITTLWFYQ